MPKSPKDFFVLAMATAGIAVTFWSVQVLFPSGILLPVEVPAVAELQQGSAAFELGAPLLTFAVIAGAILTGFSLWPSDSE